MARRDNVQELVARDSSSPRNTRGSEPPDHPFLRAEEKPRAWEEFRQSWFDDYQPAERSFEFVVTQLAEAAWELQRAQADERTLERDLRSREGGLLGCSEEERKGLDTLTKRRIRAEQSFSRFRSAAEQMRRARRLEAQQQQRSNRSRKEPVVEASDSHKSAVKTPTDVHPEPAPFTQSVHIEERDGITHTILNPENRFLYVMIRELGKHGQPVHRTIHFPDRIPREYLWATFGHDTAPKRVRWVLSQSRFEEEMLREEEHGTGHLLPDLDQYTRETILLG